MTETLKAQHHPKPADVGPMAQMILELTQIGSSAKVVNPSTEIYWEKLYTFPLEPRDRLYVTRLAPRSMREYLLSDAPVFDGYCMRGATLQMWNALATVTGSVGFWVVGQWAIEVADANIGAALWEGIKKAPAETGAEHTLEKSGVTPCKTVYNTPVERQAVSSDHCLPAKRRFHGSRQLPKARSLQQLRVALKQLNIKPLRVS